MKSLFYSTKMKLQRLAQIKNIFETMRNQKLIVIAGMICTATLLSMSGTYSEENSNGKAGHNGSPGEQTCAKSSCHDTFAVNSGPGEVVIETPGMTNWQYIPGQTYTINVTVSQANRSLFGFGFEALLSSGANAGTLTAGVGSHALNATVLGNSRRTITQLNDAGASANQHTFSFTWVAPSTAEPVTFYAAGNAASNNNSDSNDYIYTTSQAVSAVALPTAPTITVNGDTDLCNGETVLLAVTNQSDVTFNWFNESNQLVGTGTSLNVSVAGCFSVQAVNGSGTVQSVNTICTTLAALDAAFTGLSSFYCSNAATDQLLPANPNGTFSGPGVSGNSFNPALAGIGTHTIIHEVSNASGCTDQVQQTVVVGSSLDPAFSVSSSVVCENAQLVELLPVNESGSFSGIGVEGDSFNPAIGVGSYEIIHNIGDDNCLQSTSLVIEVLPAPDAGFSGIEEEYCTSETGGLMLANVGGGIFSGSGISGASFSPEMAGAGLHEISYTLESTNGCVSTEIFVVEVNQSVSADFSGLNNVYCQNEDPVALIPVDAGGFFSSESQDGFFDPAAGPGIFAVIYTNGQGSCEVSSTQFTEVLPIPDASFTGLLNGYCTNAQAVLLSGSGTFSGNGIEGNVFNPLNAETGENLIAHAVTGENGCTNTTTQSVFVYETANSNFSGLTEFYCPDSLSFDLNALNPGGVFNGPGVAGTIFNPAIAGPGVHIVEYVVDLVGCFSSTSDTVTVFEQPAVNVIGLQESYCFDDASAILFADQVNALFDGPGVVENFFQPAEAGPGMHEIECTYTDQNGCEGIWSGMVEVIELPNTTLTLENNTLSAVIENADYLWIDCSTNLPIENQSSISFSPAISGSYALQITANGCDATSACADVVIIGIDDENLKGVSVYPNPATNILHIVPVVPSSIAIYNALGNAIFQSDVPLGFHQIETDALPAGVYYVVVGSGNDRIESRFVVTK
jgi:hypothetical protein